MRAFSAKLPDTAETRLAAILRAVTLVEERLREPVTVGQMAAAAGYSPFHFCRVFALATGQTPFDYLMRRRLSEAALTLLDSTAQVIDVALDYQFGSPEAFARAFRRAHGRPPSEWRRDGDNTGQTLMAPATTAEIAARLARRGIRG